MDPIHDFGNCFSPQEQHILNGRASSKSQSEEEEEEKDMNCEEYNIQEHNTSSKSLNSYVRF
jgi:hypothetical protein